MSWSVSEAKARLSELLGRAKRGPQVIENRGEPVAVVLSKAEFDRLQVADTKPRPSPLAEFLEFTEALKAAGDLSFEVPPRKLDPERDVPFADD